MTSFCAVLHLFKSGINKLFLVPGILKGFLQRIVVLLPYRLIGFFHPIGLSCKKQSSGSSFDASDRMVTSFLTPHYDKANFIYTYIYAKHRASFERVRLCISENPKIMIVIRSHKIEHREILWTDKEELFEGTKKWRL